MLQELLQLLLLPLQLGVQVRSIFLVLFLQLRVLLLDRASNLCHNVGVVSDKAGLRVANMRIEITHLVILHQFIYLAILNFKIKAKLKKKK